MCECSRWGAGRAVLSPPPLFLLLLKHTTPHFSLALSFPVSHTLSPYFLLYPSLALSPCPSPPSSFHDRKTGIRPWTGRATRCVSYVPSSPPLLSPSPLLLVCRVSRVCRVCLCALLTFLAVPCVAQGTLEALQGAATAQRNAEKVTAAAADAAARKNAKKAAAAAEAVAAASFLEAERAAAADFASLTPAQLGVLVSSLGEPYRRYEAGLVDNDVTGAMVARHLADGSLDEALRDVGVGRFHVAAVVERFRSFLETPAAIPAAAAAVDGAGGADVSALVMMNTATGPWPLPSCSPLLPPAGA